MKRILDDVKMWAWVVWMVGWRLALFLGVSAALVYGVTYVAGMGLAAGGAG
jgi:hypothetical protein